MSRTRQDASGSRSRDLGLAAAVAAVALALLPPMAAAQQTRQPAAAATITAPKLVLPNLGAPETANRVAVASRGVGGGTARSVRTEPLRLTLLVPKQTGLTAGAEPTLYWHMSADVDRPVRLTVNDLERTDPLIEIDLTDGGRAGINHADLGRFGVALAPGREYDWSVSVTNDPAAPSSNLVASAVLSRVGLDPVAAAKLADADASGRLQLLAAEGLWYDLLAEVSGLIEARPNEPAYREIRAALLDQVQLSEVAAAERARAGG